MTMPQRTSPHLSECQGEATRTDATNSADAEEGMPRPRPRTYATINNAKSDKSAHICAMSSPAYSRALLCCRRRQANSA